MEITVNRILEDKDKVKNIEITVSGNVQSVSVWKESFEGHDQLVQGYKFDGEIKDGKNDSKWLNRTKEKRGGGFVKPNPRKDALMAAVEITKVTNKPEDVLKYADRFLEWLTKQ